MITDPDEPGYRYPHTGERLWHRPSARWVVIHGQPSYGPIVDEVDAHREHDGQRVTVKLRSLDEPPASARQLGEVSFLPRWVTEPAYLALHTAPPAPDQRTEVVSGGYARVSVGAPIDWTPVTVSFPAPEPATITHARLYDALNGDGQWYDLRTDPPTRCDPPPGWVDVADEDLDR